MIEVQKSMTFESQALNKIFLDKGTKQIKKSLIERQRKNKKRTRKKEISRQKNVVGFKLAHRTEQYKPQETLKIIKRRI